MLPLRPASGEAQPPVNGGPSLEDIIHECLEKLKDMSADNQYYRVVKDVHGNVCVPRDTEVINV